MKLRATLVLIALLLGACGDSGGQSGLPVATVVLEGTGSPLRIRAEIASTAEQRQIGLMHRRGLPVDGGMLFVFPTATLSGFFMKNTLIPLDIAFIRQDKVVDVASMVPCKVKTCPVTFPKNAYDRALEVAAGTFQRAGVSAGASVQVMGELPVAS